MCHPFQPSHPLFLSSTHQLLEDHRGEDITEAFQGGGADGHPHSRGARALLEGYCVGRLEGHEAQAEPSLDELVDETKPLLPQVVRLEPQQYLDWIAAPSTGHPIMFAQPLLERLTCTQWCACLRSCVSSCAAAPASMLSLQKEFRFPGNSSPVCCP
jgi:hypothetical protein